MSEVKTVNGWTIEEVAETEVDNYILIWEGSGDENYGEYLIVEKIMEMFDVSDNVAQEKFDNELYNR